MAWVVRWRVLVVLGSALRQAQCGVSWFVECTAFYVGRRTNGNDVWVTKYGIQSDYTATLSRTKWSEESVE